MLTSSSSSRQSPSCPRPPGRNQTSLVEVRNQRQPEPAPATAPLIYLRFEDFVQLLLQLLRTPLGLRDNGRCDCGKNSTNYPHWSPSTVNEAFDQLNYLRITTKITPIDDTWHNSPPPSIRPPVHILSEAS